MKTKENQATPAAATPDQEALPNESIADSRVLYIAFELGSKQWKLALTDGRKQFRMVTIEAGQPEQLKNEIKRSKAKFALSENSAVFSCYEAGRDGFWLHRFLQSIGVRNAVVDSSSIEVNRRRRRAKTDRLDARKLLSMLLRYHGGESKLWSVLHVPSVQDEDWRQLHRELEQLKGQRVEHQTRIGSLLCTQGVSIPIRKDFIERLEQAKQYDGKALPHYLIERIKREYELLKVVHKQILSIEAERRKLLKQSKSQRVDKVRRLHQLRGIGLNGSWLFRP